MKPSNTLKKVNPNRMELLKLKKRLSMAQRGHKMLKDKFDELMKHFLILVKQNYLLRTQVDKELTETYKKMAIAISDSSYKNIEQSLVSTQIENKVAAEFKNLLNIYIPDFKLSTSGSYTYSKISTPISLDSALKSFREIIPKLIKLAQSEKSIQLLAVEIEKTRRRVNALEYVLIPQLSNTSHLITMKLDEVERDARTRQIKVKEMVS